MKESDFKLTVYRIYWISGGTSLASVYMDAGGSVWIAPTNWIAPAKVSGVIDKISNAETIGGEFVNREIDTKKFYDAGWDDGLDYAIETLKDQQ